MCNNNCGFGGGCCLWILILIILIFACGGCGGGRGCKNSWGCNKGGGRLTRQKRGVGDKAGPLFCLLPPGPGGREARGGRRG